MTDTEDFMDPREALPRHDRTIEVEIDGKTYEVNEAAWAIDPEAVREQVKG